MSKYLNSKESAAIAEYFRDSMRKLMLLDYDGTLVPYNSNPSKALPEPSLLNLLHDLSEIKGLDLVIISGRGKEFLDEIFTNLSAVIFAEHGALHRNDGTWTSLYTKDPAWQAEIIKTMQDITDITPGSIMEKKESSVVWHYRNVEKELSGKRVPQLISKLVPLCNDNQLRLMKGKKIIEIKNPENNKGSAVVDFFDFSTYNFILAAGDDITDEDLFNVLPPSAITIKVGCSEKSTYFIRNSKDFVNFLTLLIK